MSSRKLLRKLRAKYTSRPDEFYKSWYIKHKLQQPIPFLPEPVGVSLALLDDSLEPPFLLTRALAQAVSPSLEGKITRLERARAVFDWMQEHINYGWAEISKGYANSIEVFSGKKGVCGEMANLYVVLARYAHVPSHYVSVSKDFRGKEVVHACASVDTERGRMLVDPAYHRFDVKHEEYTLLSDREAWDCFAQFRKNLAHV